MADIDKVKTALGCCIGEFPGEEYCKTCCYQPYRFGMCKADAIKDALSLLKEQQPRKTKEEVLLAIIGKQSYADIEKFKQLEELNDEYFNGILDAIRAVEKMFDERKDEHS